VITQAIISAAIAAPTKSRVAPSGKTTHATVIPSQVQALAAASIAASISFSFIAFPFAPRPRLPIRRLPLLLLLPLLPLGLLLPRE
jgi:hypothetical protein